MNEELKIIISAEINKLKTALNNGKKEIQNFVKNNKDKVKEFSDEFKKYGDAASKGLKVAGAAIVGAGVALLALSGATEEYRENQAKLNSAFEAAGGSADVAKKTYNELYRVLGEDDRSVEAANHLAKLTTNQKDLSEWTNICQGIYATFGDSLPIEGLTEAANETAKVAQVTGPLADALNWAGISEDEFNLKLQATNSEAEREALIRETLTGLYSEASSNYEKNAEAIIKQREAQIKMNEATAKLGEAMAPIKTMLAEFGAEILEKITPYIQEFAEKYGPQIQEVLDKVGTAIGNVITWLVDNWEFVSTLAIIIAGIAAAISVLNTVLSIQSAIMMANPVTWIVLAIIAAIAALIAIIIVCIKYWDEIMEVVIKVWNTIVDAIKIAVDAVVKFFTNLFESIKNIVNNIKQSITDRFNAIKDSMSEKIQNAKDSITNIFTNIKNSISERVNNIKNTVSSVFNAIKTAITNPIETAKNIVGGVVDKIKAFFNFQVTLPKIKLPHFSIKPSGWKLGDLLDGKIPKLGIDWYARGGVFESPTIFGMNGGKAMVGGEAGAEAIVPLEKNTEWLDKIAERLGANNNTPIVLTVDGKVFAQTSISSINQLTKQTGSIGLNLY